MDWHFALGALDKAGDAKLARLSQNQGSSIDSPMQPRYLRKGFRDVLLQRVLLYLAFLAQSRSPLCFFLPALIPR
jgi:hypothetical protein